MKCVVLGGGGFIGSHLSKALLAYGYEVRIFDRPNLRREINAPVLDGAEWIEGDFLNAEDVARAINGCQVIVHLVSTILPQASNENPLYDIESNVMSTLHMLEAARKANVRKIIFASSGGTVYGIPREVPISEHHPTDPICFYGIGKLAIEKYLHLYQVLYGVEYCVLRLANPYGEGQRPYGTQGAVSVFLDKALKGKVIEVWGDGTVVRDYIYIGDAIEAFLKAILYTGEYRVFNIGCGQGRSVTELLKSIETVIGRPVDRKHVSARPFDVPTNVLDISRANKALNWQPQTSFNNGLIRTWEWVCQRPRVS